MEPSQIWLIVIGIGLVVGFIVHAFMRFAQGSGLLVTLLAGIVGAVIAAQYLTRYVTTNSLTTSMFVSAAIGALVLSIVAEALFVGSRRGRVVTA